MKIFFSYFLLLFILCNSSFSQFILNSSHNPIVGDSTVSRNADTTGINQGEPGPNKTWDFQNLTYVGSPSIEYFVSPSSTLYYSQFPNSNLASIHVFSKSNTSMPHYWITSDTDFCALGYVYPSSPLMTGRFVVPYQRNHYPLSYGSSNNSVYQITVTYGNTVEYTYGTKSEICDGYGTLILPSGTYTNAIRVKTIDDEMDTVKVNGTVTQIYHNFSENYFWYVQSLKFPAFVISYQTYYNAYSKNISHYVINEPLGVNQISSTVPEKYCLYQNYPNPFNPTTNIKYQITNSSFITLKIFDILGKEMVTLVDEKQSAGTYEVRWNATAYPSGVYYYSLMTGDYSETKKMILIK